MSTDTPAVTLPAVGVWIGRLVDRLGEDPAAATKLRSLVEGRSAQIGLDGDSVYVSMRSGELTINVEPNEQVDGYGATTTAVVRAILDGSLEVSDALRSGLIEAAGSPEDVTALFHAVEVLLDASARVPGLRNLAAEFLEVAPDNPNPVNAAHDESNGRELEVLSRLGLIGDV